MVLNTESKNLNPPTTRDRADMNPIKTCCDYLQPCTFRDKYFLDPKFMTNFSLIKNSINNFSAPKNLSECLTFKSFRDRSNKAQ